jgi:hypothetical protein
LKLNHLRLELDANEKEGKLSNERFEQLRTIQANICHLDELNQQLEWKYLQLTEDVPMTKHSPVFHAAVVAHDVDDELQQQPMKSRSSTTTNGRDENSDIDSMSFNDENRDEIDDLQQHDDVEMENYDQLLAETIQILTNQS